MPDGQKEGLWIPEPIHVYSSAISKASTMTVDSNSVGDNEILFKVQVVAIGDPFGEPFSPQNFRYNDSFTMTIASDPVGEVDDVPLTWVPAKNHYELTYRASLEHKKGYYLFLKYGDSTIPGIPSTYCRGYYPCT